MTGTWEGHYFQNWVTGELVDIDENSEWASPIRADLIQDYGTLRGSMVDLKPSHDIQAGAFYQKVEPKLNWLQKREWKRFLNVSPNATLRTELPCASTINGKLDGREVTLIKDYEGHQVTSWITPSRETSEKFPSLPVYYHGELNEEGTELMGTFQVVDPSGQLPTSKGRFRLRKTSTLTAEG